MEPLTRPDCCRSNGLESKGGTAIAEKLAHLTSLQKLYLRLKRRAGALSSAAAAAASAVYVLVSSEGQGSGFLVGAAFCFPIAWRRYRAFTCPFCAVGCLRLTHVWLAWSCSDNSIGVDAALAVARALGPLTSLKELWLGYCMYSQGS